MNENIGKFIAYLRKENNMTQQELAEKLGVTDRSVSNWENGKCLPDISLYKEICNIFDIALVDLIYAKRTNKDNSYIMGRNPVVELINLDKDLYHTHDEKILRRIEKLLEECTNIELITVYEHTENIEKFIKFEECIKVPLDFGYVEETEDLLAWRLYVFNIELDYLSQYYADSKYYLKLAQVYEMTMELLETKDGIKNYRNRIKETKDELTPLGIIDAMIGHAVGDAMGVPTEFHQREELQKNPVTEMVYSPKVGVPEGTWSDDTSMELATIDSLIQKGTLDYADIMNKWVSWLDDGKYTSNGEAFDVGRTCLSAIAKFVHGTEPLKCGRDGEKYNGNGSLMRFLPIAFYTYYNKKLNEKDIIKITNEGSSLTHAHEVSRLACYIYTKYIHFLLDDLSKMDAYKKLKQVDYSSYSQESIDKYQRILKKDITKLKLDDISSSGYVVDTLEAAFWCLLTENTYEDTIIKAVNLGQDTDTIAAIAGSMAGIIYGQKGIPKRWLDKLVNKDYIIKLGMEFQSIFLNDDDIITMKAE